jgi:hypothetical protein
MTRFEQHAKAAVTDPRWKHAYVTILAWGFAIHRPDLSSLVDHRYHNEWAGERLVFPWPHVAEI